MRIPRLIRIGAVNRVPILVHWSVPLLVGLFLVASLDRPLTATAAILAYLAVLTLHELGHQFVAHRCGYRVSTVEVYPVHAICRFERPESAVDAAKIAWGGALAQFLVALPLIARVMVWGYTRFQALNAVLAIGGFISVSIAVFNLLPIRPLDGATAWSLVPRLLPRRRRLREKTALEVFRDIVDKQTKE